KRRIMNALLGELLKSRVKRRGNVKRMIVVVDQTLRLVLLLFRVEGARWKLLRVYRASRHRPVQFRNRGIINDPGLDPMVESRGHELILFVPISPRERLEAVHGVQVPDGPGDEG